MVSPHSSLTSGHHDTDTLLSSGQLLVGHSAPVTSVSWSRTGDWLLTSSADHSVKIWDWRLRRQCLNLVTRGKDTPLYSESVTRASLFYLDNILLSASSNKLYIHNIKLPEDRQDKSASSGQFRLVKTVNMSDCKTITSMSCINQFYSFLCIVGCSDRSVRVYDVNQAKVSCPHSDNLSNLPQSKSKYLQLSSEKTQSKYLLDLNNIEFN